ncbi:Probable DNA-directed RNA polymerases I and III subunit RPAC2 [Camponotus floridanus]|uniref:Probable DNA-directed RNA polymerases I and III subunit RPAC2 n=2 Tax=Camponotus floridanus TaxID=104421 RepID=E2B1J9_CAMFO|nr:probable DNA-directed RNA polymerases I and III subunit RPAC2 [Camponotus floridanus]EFN60456.1 Probable DNA-directed RNA polymerases I and III subunit RPAC2 [Camponotus floridanus]
MEKRLSRIPGNQGITYGTFVFVDEGHTLGNALSYVINQYPGIKICAYTVPHPAENKIHFNIQTTGESAIEVLKRGLQDLERICDHTIETFDTAYKNFKSNDTPMDTT